MLSVDGPQLSETDVPDALAVSEPGAVGGDVSPIVADASDEAGPTLPAASSAATL